MKSSSEFQEPRTLRGLAMRTVGASTRADFASPRIPRMIVFLAAALALSVTLGASGAPSAPLFTRITAGYDHTCALTSAGGVKCWGSNRSGQVGKANCPGPPYCTTPLDVVGLRSGVRAISAGARNTCALTSRGGVKCWGSGVLLNGSNFGTSLTPVNVAGLTSGVSAISTSGGPHSCVVTSAGGAKCWGDGGHGELGNGSRNSGPFPPRNVVGLTSGVSAIVASIGYFTCALTSGGGAKCWGYNVNGQLGNGAAHPRGYEYTPVDVVGLTSGVKAIAAGEFHTCAVTSGGGAKCWGSNGDGELGNGSTIPGSSTPVDVAGLTSGVSAIAAGYSHTCAVTTSGGAKCWGDNSTGQLGNGTQTKSTTPVDVAGLTSGVKAIAAGGFHTCALTNRGKAKCWGGNIYGQLGNGSQTSSTKPVDVLFSAKPGGTSALKLTLGGASPQRLLAQKGITVTARCNRPCSLSATGSVTILGTRYVFGLTRATARLAAAGRRTLTLRLPVAEQKRFRRLFQPGQQTRDARAVIRVKARDDAGHTSTATRTVVIV